MPTHRMIHEMPDGDEGLDVEYELVFSIEPYYGGSRDEPPSGGSATLEEVLFEGNRIHHREWVAHGFTKSVIKDLEDRAYRSFCEDCESSYWDSCERDMDEDREN